MKSRGVYPGLRCDTMELQALGVDMEILAIQIASVASSLGRKVGPRDYPYHLWDSMRWEQLHHTAQHSLYILSWLWLLERLTRRRVLREF